MRCTRCQACTGFGKSCNIFQLEWDRDVGESSDGIATLVGLARRVCGCGGGDAGCERCGFCKDCAKGSSCISIVSPGQSNEGRLQVGELVILRPDYKDQCDAARGPLNAGDIGELVKDDGSGKPYQVRFNGVVWWYKALALCKAGGSERSADAGFKAGGSERRADAGFSVGDSVMLSANVRDAGDAAEGPLSTGDVGEVVGVDVDESNMPYHVHYKGRHWWYHRKALVKATGASPSPTSTIVVTSENARVGLRVKRGPNWEWLNQDGGPGRLGRLVESESRSPGWCRVQWDSGMSNLYRLDGQYDLAVAEDEIFPDEFESDPSSDLAVAEDEISPDAFESDSSSDQRVPLTGQVMK